MQMVLQSPACPVLVPQMPSPGAMDPSAQARDTRVTPVGDSMGTG